jgi:hypothetical protein
VPEQFTEPTWEAAFQVALPPPPRTVSYVFDGGESQIRLCWLVPTSGPQKDEVLPVPHSDAGSTIGSSDDAHIRIDDSALWPEHGRILVGQSGYRLIALAPTMVNGRVVFEHWLADGDEIVMGATRLLFKCL